VHVRVRRHRLRRLRVGRSVGAAATSVHLSGHVGGQTPIDVGLHISRTGGSARVSAADVARPVYLTQLEKAGALAA